MERFIRIHILIMAGFIVFSNNKTNANPADPSDNRPNIVLLLTDDLGYGDPVCYNPQSKAPTPYMDKLAREGRRFTDAHSPTSVCSPTRYAILTGRYAWRTRLKLGVTRPIKDGPTTRGFDYFFVMVGMTPDPCLIENDKPIMIGSGKAPTIPGVSSDLLAPWKIENTPSMLNEKVKWYLDQRAADPSKKPFFLYYALTTPHQPIMPSAQFRGKTGFGEACDFVHQTDDSIGQVMNSLEKNGMLNNTIVIVTSDNGSPGYAEANSPTASVMDRYDHLSSGPWRGMKGDTFEGGHRVPFIIRWPGKITPNTVSKDYQMKPQRTATTSRLHFNPNHLRNRSGKPQCITP